MPAESSEDLVLMTHKGKIGAQKMATLSVVKGNTSLTR